MKSLILIDVQKGFDDPHWGIRNNAEAENNIAALLKHWRKQAWPIIHVQHLSLERNSPLQRVGAAFKDFVDVQSGERIFQKNVNSAFIGTSLEENLREQDIRDIVIVGLTTDHCVSTTTRMASNLGFKVTVVADATATFERTFRGKIFSASSIHESALVSLNGEFAVVKDTSELI